MYAASTVNVAVTFLSAGITLLFGTDGMLYCRICPDRVRCLIVRIDHSQESEPLDQEVDALERELYLEYWLDGVGEGIPSESELRIILILLRKSGNKKLFRLSVGGLSFVGGLSSNFTMLPKFCTSNTIPPYHSR
jgi:hypothetical protein